jgi:Fic family protein
MPRNEILEWFIAPPGTQPVGYSYLIWDLGLRLGPRPRLSFVASHGARVERLEADRLIVTYPPGYATGPNLRDHVEFALKHEGVDLGVLSAAFDPVMGAEIEHWVTESPTSAYSRRAWFLYELLTGQRLELPDAEQGNYVPALDPEAYFVAAGVRSRRHRVIDNLLGPPAFCPVVRRTPALASYAAMGLDQEAAHLLGAYDQDVIRRAISYLYTKETRSSFAIEGEVPNPTRTDRFVAAVQSVESLEVLGLQDLVRLQNAVMEPRAAESDLRTEQNYVGEQVDVARQRIHFIPPRPKDIRELMEAWLQCTRRMAESRVDPVVQAAVVSFGFVFLHPFMDGNGRLHRVLIHHVLSRRGFSPPGVLFPVSAVINQRRSEYDAALESISRPLMELIDSEESADGALTVHGETAHLYRYLDYTRLAEDLWRWIEQTVRNELREELEFIRKYRLARESLAELIDLPDRRLNLLVRLVLHGGGRLSKAKRSSQFADLDDATVARLEGAIRGAFELEPPPP